MDNDFNHSLPPDRGATLERRGLGAVVLAAAVLVTLNLGQYLTIRSLADAVKQISRLNKVLTAADFVTDNITRYHVNVRGYVRTGDVSFLAEREKWKKELAANLQAIEQAAGDAAPAQRSVAALRQATDAKVELLEHMIALKRAKDPHVSLRFATDGDGVGLSLRITEAAESIEAETLAKRSVLQDSVRRSARRSAAMEILAITLASALVALAVWNIHRGIIRRRRVEIALRRRSSELEEAQELARIGSWTWEVEPDRVFWSPELYRIAGRDPALAPPTYQEHPTIYTPDSWTRLSAAVSSSLQYGTPYELDLELLRPDGSRVWAVARGCAERDKSGRVVRLHGTLQDVSARKQAENALREAKESAEAATRVKSEFLANMSHEIRTPMNGIIGMTSLLLQTNLSPEQRDGLEIIRSSGEALLAIINDILDYSKIEANRLQIEQIPFKLRSMVEETIDVVAHLAGEKNLRLRFFVDESLPEVMTGDPLRLRQILLNLLSNGIKFTEHGSVTLHVSPVEESADGILVHFAVSDTGIGLTPEQQKNLFQSFTQGDASTTRKHGGTGLGLSISKRLAEFMGGSIGIDCTQVRGSTFWFTAKLVVTDEAVAAALPNDVVRGARVLVVADQPVDLLLTRQQLEAAGMKMVPATSRPEAIQCLPGVGGVRNALHSVIIDVEMRETDGIALAREIRAMETSSHLPLVLLSSLREAGLLAEASALGNCTCLMKPLTQSSLRRMLCSDPAAVRPSMPSACASSSGRPRVLVAEDNLINQRVAASMLKRLGCDVEVANNGREAVDAAKAGGFNLILMDCQMPYMDGFDATIAIRREESGRRRTPIVALTANALTGDRERCLEVGMDDHMPKPVDFAALRAGLHRWLAPATVQSSR